MVWSQKTKNDHNNPKIAPTITKLTNSVLYYILHIVFKFRKGYISILKIIQDSLILAVKVRAAKKKHVLISDVAGCDLASNFIFCLAYAATQNECCSKFSA